MSAPTHPNTRSERYEGGIAFDGHTHQDRGDGRCATCQTKLGDPPPPFVPSLAFIRERMPDRSDKGAYLIHALRFFEDVLDYAERLDKDA